MSNSLLPNGLQHARLFCLSPNLEFTQTHVQWVSDAIQSSHPLLSPFPPSSNLPASESFQMSQFFPSGGQNIGVSASASILPMNIQDWFPLEWTSWISLQSKGLSRVFSNTTVQKPLFRASYSQLNWYSISKPVHFQFFSAWGVFSLCLYG